MDETPELNRSAAGDRDAGLTRAAEHHVRRALNSRWRFVTVPALDRYLNRLIERIARVVPGAPSSSRIALFDDDARRSLPLPSGTILLSLGRIDFVEDEAELVFVLARDFGHVANGTAGRRLLDAGLRAVSAAGDRPVDESWAETALRVARDGFGEEAEIAADRIAFEAVHELGYDLEAVDRYLERIERLAGADSDRLAGGTRDRLRQERRRMLRAPGAWHPGIPVHPRVNREVLRRAVGGRRVRRSELDAKRLSPFPQDAEETSGSRPARRSLPWIAVVAAIVLGWILLAVLL